MTLFSTKIKIKILATIAAVIAFILMAGAQNAPQMQTAPQNIQQAQAAPQNTPPTQTTVQTNSQEQQLTEPLIRWMFTVGLLCISVTWVVIPLIFAHKNKLDEMLDLLRRGAVIRFVTITYIVLVIVILSLIGKLQGDKVATLLASIAGYVLGQATSHETQGSQDTSDGAPSTVTSRQP